MRKTIGLMISLCMALLCVTGCGNSAKPSSAEPLKNYAEPMPLSQEQLVNLLSTGDQKVLLFHFKTEQAYKNREIWVETYKDGQLVKSWAAGINSSDEAEKPLDIQAAVIISNTPDYQWTIVLQEQGGTKASHHSELNQDYTKKGGNAAISLNEPVAVAPEKEIVLYANFFKEDGEFETISDLQRLTDEEALKGYDYLHLIKCRFS